MATKKRNRKYIKPQNNLMLDEFEWGGLGGMNMELLLIKYIALKMEKVKVGQELDAA